MLPEISAAQLPESFQLSIKKFTIIDQILKSEEKSKL